MRHFSNGVREGLEGEVEATYRTTRVVKQVFFSWCICYVPGSTYILNGKVHQTCFTCMVSVTIKKLIPWPNISSIFETNEYQPKETLFKCYQTLQATGPPHGVCFTAEHEINKYVDKQENIVWQVECTPHAST
jgi:hypothetical protein